MNNCSIIIPIYNAYDCLKPCIDSVIKNTNLNDNNIILINDCSTDERVLPLLQEYAIIEGIVLLENSANQGFVKTVNKGIKYAKSNDVLLLNSDTEVTENWLEKIQKCAYSHDRIATVTPLSNNATLASVPKAFKANDIPEGYTLETFAKFIEKTSLNKYPEIPTGHGFCLFIKRSAIDKVGLFDEESFGKGYGEENDFCFRCLDIGYFHVLCDNTFVLHKESKSFLSNKSKEIRQGLAVLRNRYSYMNKLDSWVVSDAISFIGENVKLQLGLANKKPNILFLIHDWSSLLSNMGGTTLHVKDIILSLRDKYNFHVLHPQNGAYSITSYWANSEETSEMSLGAVTQFSVSNFYNLQYKKIFEKVVNAYAISAVHIHHLMGHYFDAIDVCQEQKIKLIITLHDYYFACPLINKVYLDDKYCGNGEPEKCKYCLYGKYPITERAEKFIDSWRTTSLQGLKKSDVIIAPSNAAKEEMYLHYPELNISVIEHGINLRKIKPYRNIRKKNFDIAFIGAISVNKGRGILEQLIKKSKGINIHLFGITDSKMPKSRRFFDHGEYKREQLTNLILKNKIDLICLFSIWPETYSYTLTEAISCGVPVIAFDFGAIAERIKKYNLGYVLPYDSSINEIISSIKSIKNDKERYNSILDSIKQYHIKTTAEMGEEYDKIYSKSSKTKQYNVEEIKSIVMAEKPVVQFTNAVDFSFDSIKWRIVSKIRFPRPVGKAVRKLIAWKQKFF